MAKTKKVPEGLHFVNYSLVWLDMAGDRFLVKYNGTPFVSDHDWRITGVGNGIGDTRFTWVLLEGESERERERVNEDSRL
jgi:hypothetical protein